jgi:signal peptidase II
VAVRSASRSTAGVRGVALLAVAGAVVAVDQLTKTWALHHVPLTGRHLFGPVWLLRTLNTGAAFGLGTGVTPVLEIVAAVLIVVLFSLSRRVSRGAPRVVVVGVGLVLGGAVGNLLDRLVRHHDGGVIDWIDIARVGNHDWWPVFNVADAAITIGAVVLVVAYLLRSSRSRPPADSRDR